MRFLKSIAIAALVIFAFSACDGVPTNNRTPVEQPHLYWKDIDVVVTDINKTHWYASTHWYSVDITVKSEEYGLEKSFNAKGSGAFSAPKEWEYEKGDIVKARLYSWVMESTGEVVRREIHSLS